MTALALLICSQASFSTAYSYSGLPVVTSHTEYRIVTENVAIAIHPPVDKFSPVTETVTSTTVYRNLGAIGQVVIQIPRYAQNSGSTDFPIKATWDNQPMNLTTSGKLGVVQPKDQNSSGDSSLYATEPFIAQGTHALRITYSLKLGRTGYSEGQYKTAYKLNGDHPVELFTIAYRYPNGMVFGLPTVKPDLGWDVGDNGAAVRKVNFVPGNQESSIEFYGNGFRPIG